MKRKSLVTAISLPKEIDTILNKLQKDTHKSRSGLLRDMIAYYVDTFGKTNKSRDDSITDQDANQILKLYYKLISEAKTKPTIVIGAAIVNKIDQVIIGQRKAQDTFVKDLQWTFPSGTFKSLEFEKEVVETCLRETGLKVRLVQLIHARIFPDSPKKSVRIVVLYYHCHVVSGKEKPGGDFNKLKWVPAREVNRHFTTSVSDEIMNFLGTLCN